MVLNTELLVLFLLEAMGGYFFSQTLASFFTGFLSEGLFPSQRLLCIETQKTSWILGNSVWSHRMERKNLWVYAVLINTNCQTSQDKFRLFLGFCLLGVDIQEQESLLGALCGYEETTLSRVWLSFVCSFCLPPYFLLLLCSCVLEEQGYGKEHSWWAAPCLSSVFFFFFCGSHSYFTNKEIEA